MPEIQDLYDINRRPTGEQFVRGGIVPPGRFRLGVQVWLQNDAGEYLLTQRHPRKKKPLMWEPSGGAVVTGENTLTAGIREVAEEIGVCLKPEALKLVRSSLCSGNEFLDTYVARWNGSIKDLVLQADEVVDACWADIATLQQLDRDGLMACDWAYLFANEQATK